MDPKNFLSKAPLISNKNGWCLYRNYWNQQAMSLQTGRVTRVWTHVLHNFFSHLNVGIFSYAIQINAKSYYRFIVDISGHY